MEWRWAMTRNADGTDTRKELEAADNSYLKLGILPDYRRIWANGVEVWPGNHGLIPDDWDGIYPAIPPTVYRMRSGRSRRA